MEVPREILIQFLKENSEHIIDQICFNDVLFDYLCTSKMPRFIHESIDRQLNAYWPKDEEIVQAALHMIRKFSYLHEHDETQYKSVDAFINEIEKNLNKVESI